MAKTSCLRSVINMHTLLWYIVLSMHTLMWYTVFISYLWCIMSMFLLVLVKVILYLLWKINLESLSNYRRIILVPVISKVLEMFILLNFCDDNLVSGNLQFGLKKGIDCAKAIFTLRTTTGYFNGHCCSIIATSLDISKVFIQWNTINSFAPL